MLVKRYGMMRLWSTFILLLSLDLVTACLADQADTTVPEIRIQLLVKAPEDPLQAGKPVDVRSRSEDTQHGISHVELYAVQLPSGENNVLIRSDAAPFQQTSFSASQIFTPVQPGHYMIKVVGYNKKGEWAESEYLSFDVQ